MATATKAPAPSREKVKLFKPALRRKARARVALVGMSGSGKTITALRLAQALKGEGQVAVIDGEAGSSQKYQGPLTVELPGGEKYENTFEFDIAKPKGKSLEYLNRLLLMMTNCDQDGDYTVLIGDCGSHEWMKLLELVDEADSKFTTGWRQATPIHNRWIQTMLDSPLHQIWTFRQKSDYILEEKVIRGKKQQVPRKVGMAPVARDGTAFEFDVVGDFLDTGILEITKSRCPQIPKGKTYEYPGEDDLGRELAEWLDQGADPEDGDDTQTETGEKTDA